jgi:hypothetical protein
MPFTGDIMVRVEKDTVGIKALREQIEKNKEN